MSKNWNDGGRNGMGKDIGRVEMRAFKKQGIWQFEGWILQSYKDLGHWVGNSLNPCIQFGAGCKSTEILGREW